VPHLLRTFTPTAFTIVPASLTIAPQHPSLRLLTPRIYGHQTLCRL
jgi:hypothetical protein